MAAASASKNESWRTVGWQGDAMSGFVRLIDQTRLPDAFIEIDLQDVPSVWEAIRSLRVRGAPAIGIAAGFGAVLGARTGWTEPDRIEPVRESLAQATAHLRTSRPTAVNLFWVLDRIDRVAASWPGSSGRGLIERLLEEAQAIHDEDEAMCRAMGVHGNALIEPGWGILTHCNAGGLATSAYGTALAAIYAAHESGKGIQVYADETRPLLQGSRLTAWELSRQGVPVTLICDNMAAQVMKEGKVQMVIVGADRIAANGDVANKIGTYGLAILANAHNIPFCVAAPSSTFDLTLASGEGIPIEYRDPAEVTSLAGHATAPAEIKAFNPAFDVTPARLITAIVTERGVIRPVNADAIAECLNR